jgi:hypothetical protein
VSGRDGAEEKKSSVADIRTATENTFENTFLIMDTTIRL